MKQSSYSKIGIAALVAGALALSLSLWDILIDGNDMKVGYVRSNDLVSRYLGTRECQRIVERTARDLKANIDTLHNDYRSAVDQYQRDFVTLSVSDRDGRERTLGEQEGQLATYVAEVQKRAKEEETKLMQGVLNQINSFVEKYGKEKGYDLILGTTAAGSLLYAEESTDITDAVLEELNQSYARTHAHPAETDTSR